MANNVAASMKASIIIDKKEIISSALSAYAEAQKEIAGNKIELLVDVSDDKARERLKEISKELAGKDYIIKFKNQGIEETMKSLDELFGRIKDVINLSNGISNSISKANNKQFVQGEIDAVSKLKDIVNKTTITFEDFKTIIANLPSDKIGQLNKMLGRTFELTSDVGTSLGVMTSELGKYFTITGTRSSTSFFLSNEGEFTRKPNKNKTNFVDDEIYTKGMKYDPSDLADFAMALQKQEQQAIDTAKAQEKLAETEKNLGKSTIVDNSKLKETIDYYREIYEIQRKLDDAFIQSRQLSLIAAYDFDSVEEGEKALNLCNEMIAKMKEYYSLAQKEEYSSNALKEMSSDIEDVTQNIKPAVERALSHIKTFTEQRMLDNEIGLKIDNSKSNAPKELLDEYISVISKINNGFLDGQEGISILNTKAKELGVTFDETSRKWVNVAATSSSGDINESSVQIDKLKNKLDELSKRYEELSKSTIVSGKDIDLVDNEEFQKLSKEFATLKQELSDIKIHMELFEQSAMSYDAFIPYENQISELSSRIEKLINDYQELRIAQKELDGNKSNISSGKIKKYTVASKDNVPKLASKNTYTPSIDDLIDESFLEDIIEELEKESLATKKATEANEEYIETKKKLNSLSSETEHNPDKDKEISKENNLLQNQSKEVVEIEQALNVLTERYIKLTNIVQNLTDGWGDVSNAVKDALQQLKLFDENGKFLGTLNEQGMVAQGAVMNGTHAIISRRDTTYARNGSYYGTDNYLDLLIKKEQEAYEQGINLARILSVIEGYDGIYEIQEQAKGNQVHDISRYSTLESYLEKCKIITEATDEQLQKLLKDAMALNNLGFKLDFGVGNILYDKNSGFSFIDLELRELDEKIPETQDLVRGLFKSLAGGELVEKYTNNSLSNFASDDNLKRLHAMLSVAQRLQSVFDVSEVPYFNTIINAQKEVSDAISAPIEDTFQGDKIEEAVKVADQLEEEIQEITVATDKAGKALEEYKEKWKVLKQVGDVGDDKYSATFEKNAGQIESVVWKAKRDADGNVLFDSNGEKEYEMLSVTISNYQKLESVIVSADNELRKLEDRRQNLLKQNPTASTSGLDAQITYQKNYISLLEQTVKHISQADEYLLEEQQIIEARNKAEKEYQLTKGSKQDESVAKDYQKRNDAITKANRLLNTQEKTVEHIAKTYDKALNPDLEKSVNNPNDLAELAQKKSEIQTLINQLKNAPRDASNEQEYLRLERLIAEYKDLADYKKKANNPTKQELGGQKLETLVAQTVAEYDKLIIRAEKYGDATKEIVEKLKQQRDLLAQTDSNGKYTANANDFYSARDVLKVQKADFGVFEAEAKSAERAVKQAQKLAEEKRKARQADKQATQSSVDKALKDQLDAWEAIQKIRLQIAQTDDKDTTKLQNLKTQKKKSQEDFLNAQKVLKANEDLYDKESQLAKLELERLETNEKINKLKLNNVDVSSVISNADAKASDFEARKHQSEEYRTNVEKLKQSIDELRTLENSRVPSKLLSENEAQKIKDVIASVEEYVGVIKNMSASEKGSTSISRGKEIGKIEDYMKKNTRMSKEFKAELEELLHMLRTGGDSVNVENVHDQFLKIQDRIRLAKQEGISFFDIFNTKVVYGAAAKLANYYLSFYDFIRYGRNAVNVVVELNTQMINLSKVSEQTVAQISKDFSSYAKTAKEVGATISDTISATTNWAKNGYNIPDSQELAKVALIYKNVGDIDIESANESLISTIRGFKLEAEDAMHVIDVFNEVSNNEAISAGGIGEALKRSAASFSAANTSLEQSVALITATNSVLQDEEKTGNMWRTVSARIRGAKTELEEAGLETEGMVESTSKLQGLIKGMTGFDILKEDGKTFKDIFDIVLNIGEEFQNLSDIDQAALLEALAGKQQSNALAAALNNVDILKKSYEEAMNAEGSALEEQEKWAQGLQYSIDRIKASLQELAQDLLKSDFLKGLIESGNTLINVFDKLVKNIGLLGTLGLGGGAFLGIKNAGREKCYPSSNMPVMILFLIPEN